MKDVLKRLGEVARVAGENLLESFKKNPAMTRVAVMATLSSLAIWSPEQLSGIERWLDAVTPVLIIALGLDLKANVIPANGSTGAEVKAPVKVPAAVPAGPSGAF